MILTISQVNELRKIKRFEHWLDQYALVQLFRIKYRRFPRCKEDFPSGNNLGRWYNDLIKASYRKGRLKLWQVRLLNKFNYQFEVADRWEANFAVLKKGWGSHPGSWPYVYYYTPHLKRIEKWCKDQRLYYTKGTLSQDKIKKLNSINFAWDNPGDVVWQNHYKNILKWIIENKRIPKRYSNNPKERSYAIWIAKERSKINSGQEKKDRAVKIKTLCKKMKYNPVIFRWNESRSMYEKWCFINGGRPNKRSNNLQERRLGNWFQNQICLLHKGLLSEDHAVKINKFKKMFF